MSNTIISIGVGPCVLLEPHCVISGLVFLVDAHVVVGLHGGPGRTLPSSGGLSELAHLRRRLIVKGGAILTQNEVRGLEVVHHRVGVVLVKSALVGVWSELSICNVLFESLVVDEISFLVLNRIRKTQIW